MSGPPGIPDFESMYRADSDPWQVQTSWYERRKLAVLLASLPLSSTILRNLNKVSAGISNIKSWQVR